MDVQFGCKYFVYNLTILDYRLYLMKSVFLSLQINKNPHAYVKVSCILSCIVTKLMSNVMYTKIAKL